MITLGILADTHIPDRLPRLHRAVLPVFREANVQAILHAGDVCVPGVLAELATVAPVHAVRGNRDWVSLGRLPKTLRLELGGVKIGLAHGHGSLPRYLLEKPYNLLFGLQEERYIQYVLSLFPDVDVVVFGHMHRVVNQRRDGKLVLDPGSACCTTDKEPGPSLALLQIHDSGQAEAEIVYLNRART
jgi:hypothetical protein